MNALTADIAIEARGLVKRFGKTTALDGVDLTARKGTVLGLLGPNGAGKTTAVRCLATLIRPDAGSASVLGYDVQHDAHQVRQLIGLTGQYASVDEMLSGFNNLVMIGRLLGIHRKAAKARASELLDRFGLADAAARPAKTYSGGMRRRLDLAASMVGRPAVLFLDEPTTGLDPRSRTELWAMVRGLTADGATVLLTTQYLEEADHLCHDITVIDHGAVIAAGTPDELKARVGGQVLAVTAADPSRAADIEALVAERTGLTPATSPDSGTVSVKVSDPALVPALVRELDDKGIAVEELTLRKPSLDEVFLSLTGPAPSAGPASPSGGNEVPPEAPTGRTQEIAGIAVTTLTPTRHLSPVTGLANTFTLTWRSLLKLKTNPEDLPALVLTPIMYLVLFTYIFGGAISGNVHNYLQFELPGILVLAVIFSTLGTGQMLSQDIETGVFDRFRSLPIARWAPLFGAVLGDVTRYALSVAVTLAFGILLGFRIQTEPLAAAAGCLLVLVFALAMCWFSALLGLIAGSARGVQWIGSLIYFPLTFGSNVLVPTAKLPGWLQAFVKGNPMTFLTEAERGLLVGGPVETPVIRTLAWSLGLVVVFAPIAVEVYRRRT